MDTFVRWFNSLDRLGLDAERLPWLMGAILLGSLTYAFVYALSGWARLNQEVSEHRARLAFLERRLLHVARSEPPTDLEPASQPFGRSNAAERSTNPFVFTRVPSCGEEPTNLAALLREVGEMAGEAAEEAKTQVFTPPTMTVSARPARPARAVPTVPR